MTAEEFKLQAEELRERLMGVARRYLGDDGEAEDIVQDTMLKLWLMRADLQSPVWGIGAVVTRNLCIDSLRRRRPTIDISRLPDSEEPGDDGSQIEQMLMIVDSLPSSQRTILRMRHLEGMGMNEIAAVMGSTEQAVRKKLSRARMVVRRKLMAWIAAACIVGIISMLAVRWMKMESEEECVTYIYGKKYSDEQTVMREMRRAMGDLATDNPQNEIERELNELFE